MIIAILFGIILAIISVNDFLFFRIEKEYVLSLMILYIISCLFGFSGQHILYGLTVATVVFAICFVLNQYGMIGGGDVKLLVPLLLFAEDNAIDFFVGMSIGGFFLGLTYFIAFRKIFFLRRKIVLTLYVLKKRHKNFMLLNFVLLSLNRISRKSVAFRRYNSNALKQEIPYGIALACGGFFLIWNWCRW